MRRPNVLLVGETLHQYSYLAQRVTNWGGECRFAVSNKEVYALLARHTFELIISEMKLVDGPALRMSPLLEGSPCSLFCFHPVRDSCLWIPIVERGQICLGAPALRPNQFGQLLRCALTEERTAAVIASEPRTADSLTALSPSSPQSLTEARQLAKAG